MDEVSFQGLALHLLCQQPCIRSKTAGALSQDFIHYQLTFLGFQLTRCASG